MKAIIFSSIVLLVMLQYKLWFAGGGVPDMWGMRAEVAEQVAKNIELRERNAQLQAEIRDLKGGESAIEAHARNGLGMVKGNETYYQIVAKPKRHKRSHG